MTKAHIPISKTSNTNISNIQNERYWSTSMIKHRNIREHLNIDLLGPLLYLLLWDWNLILRSVCAEYEMRKWHEPTCSGSKYLNFLKHNNRNSNHQCLLVWVNPKYSCTEMWERWNMDVYRSKDKAYLGILLPSKATLAEDAVSASVNWISACQDIP